MKLFFGLMMVFTMVLGASLAGAQTKPPAVNTDDRQAVANPASHAEPTALVTSIPVLCPDGSCYKNAFNKKPACGTGPDQGNEACIVPEKNQRPTSPQGSGRFVD